MLFIHVTTPEPEPDEPERVTVRIDGVRSMSSEPQETLERRLFEARDTVHRDSGAQRGARADREAATD
jgi:hypothetical protein